MELDAVEAGSPRARGRVGEERGSDEREVADVRLLEVGHALAGPEGVVLELALRQDGSQGRVVHGEEPRADGGLVGERRASPAVRVAS